MGSSVNGTFMQERKFLGYHPSDKFSDHSLIFMENNRIIAVLPAAVVQQEDKCILHSHPGASHGGLIIKSSLGTPKCLELVNALVEYCAMTGFDYIRLKPVPRVYHSELSDQLDFALRFSGFKIEYTELATALELKEGEEHFLKQVMSSTAFRNYQKALKSGLSIIDDADINDYWGVLENKLKLRHNAKPTHTLEEIKYLKALYPDRIKLFAAYKGEILTAGVLVFLLNERVINCFYIAHDDRYQNLRPLNLIFGYMMEWGQKNSFSYLDWGISTEEKGSSVNTGLFRFKESYGGHGVLRECYLYDVNSK
ncbi:MAG: hypothetical protein K0R80_3060 [Clostridia bacterium]|nr:hypothetical protein [Clostridia bacterium]